MMNALSIGLLSQSCGHWFRIEHIRPFSHGTVSPAIMIAPSSLIKVRTAQTVDWLYELSKQDLVFLWAAQELTDRKVHAFAERIFNVRTTEFGRQIVCVGMRTTTDNCESIHKFEI